MGTSKTSIAQIGAVIVGVAYLAIGIIGFAFTGFGEFVQDTGDGIIGFDLNPFHNIIHFVVGAYLLFVSRLGRTITEGALIGGGLVYIVAAILGFDNHLQIISINSATAPDNFLHIASGLAALLLGLISSLNNPEGSRDTVEQY
jgi:hypothetical protein